MELCPLLAIEYLKKNLKFHEKPYLDTGAEIGKIMTRGQRRFLFENGFKYPPKIMVYRNTIFDGKLIAEKSSKIIMRRNTVGCNLNKTPSKSTKPVPQLVPLRSILKQPKSVPFNINARKSFFGVTYQPGLLSRSQESLSSSTLKNDTQKITTSTPKLAKGTAVNIILFHFAEKSMSSAKDKDMPGPSTATVDKNLLVRSVQFQDPETNFGRLTFSDDSDDSDTN